MARHLENRGVVPVVVIVGDRASIHGDALTNLTVCERLGIPIYDIRAGDDIETALAHAADADLIVDAIFGTGLNRAPSGIHADVIRDLAELRLPVLAVDLPSGANASSQTPFDPCVQAEVTVTFAAPKLCHVFEPAALYCGEIIVADISIPEAAIEDENGARSRSSRRRTCSRTSRRACRDAQRNVRPCRRHRRLAGTQRRGGAVRARRDPHRRGTGVGDDRCRNRASSSTPARSSR